MMRQVYSILFALFFLLCGGNVFAQTNESDKFVIVLDAGHGGSAFPGATYGGVMEKDINLAVALKLGALIEKELPQVKVVYTRKTDTALGKTLNEDLTARANIANRAGGDFFISIHANAATKNTVYGPETLIMGESEKETRYNESVLYNNNKEELIDMSDENTAAMVRAYIQNLQFTYGEYSEMMAKIMQSHYSKGGRNVRKMRRQLLKVLYATDMPSVLTELGFMTNAQELAYMKSQKGQNELARMLCNAVKEYVGHIERMSGKGVVASKPATISSATAASEQKPTAPKPTQKVTEPQTKPQQKPEQKQQQRAKPQQKPEQKQQQKLVQPQQAKPQKVQPQNTAQAKPVTTGSQQNSTSGYAIQVMALNKILGVGDATFKSYRNKVRRLEGSGPLKHKYCYGEYSSREEAVRHLSEVRKVFGDAFIVRYEGDNVVK